MGSRKNSCSKSNNPIGIQISYITHFHTLFQTKKAVGFFTQGLRQVDIFVIIGGPKDGPSTVLLPRAKRMLYPGVKVFKG
jgi:hypothetical protein